MWLLPAEVSESGVPDPSAGSISTVEVVEGRVADLLGAAPEVVLSSVCRIGNEAGDEGADDQKCFVQ